MEVVIRSDTLARAARVARRDGSRAALLAGYPGAAEGPPMLLVPGPWDGMSQPPPVLVRLQHACRAIVIPHSWAYLAQEADPGEGEAVLWLGAGSESGTWCGVYRAPGANA